MAVTDADVLRVRAMIAEVSASSAVTDDAITEAIKRYPREDARGEAPFVESTTTPGTLTRNPDWMATYDLHAAAAELWEQKAAALAADYDFSADGGNYHRSQAWDQAMRMARYHQARRSPTTITQRPEPLGRGTESINDD